MAEYRSRCNDHGRRAAARLARHRGPTAAGGSISSGCSRRATAAPAASSLTRRRTRPAGSSPPTRSGELLAFARRRGLWLIADEVYARIVYGNRAAPSFLEQAGAEDRLIAVNSFSKSWAMTGWRLGWMTTPPELLPILEKLIEFNTSGAPTFLQHAAIAAIRGGEPFIAEMVARCHAARDAAIEGLRSESRVAVARPDGAFYAFFRVDGMTDSLAFAQGGVAARQGRHGAGQRLRADGRGLSAALLRARAWGRRRGDRTAAAAVGLSRFRSSDRACPRRRNPGIYASISFAAYR